MHVKTLDIPWTAWLLSLLCSTLSAQDDRPAQDATPKAPNVLFLVIDDLNDWVGCLGGHPQTRTPHIDRLAARSTVFVNAHCQAPICNPSRVSMLTGRYPSTSGVYLLKPSAFRVSKALKNVKTLPESFAARGYRTIGGGKIFHNSSARETFDEYGPRGHFGPLPKPKARLNYKKGNRLWDWGQFPASDEQMPDTKIATWATEQLARTHDKPFFLAVGFLRPHVPMYAPKRWWDGLPDEADIELPKTLANDREDLSDYAKALTHGSVAPRHAWIVKNAQWHRAVRAYLACVNYVDHQVGRVLTALDASPHKDNTIVILCSDHGFHLGEKQRWAKRSLWTRSTRVPLLVSLPRQGSSARCARPVGLIDIYPTLVELCSLRADKGLEGHSLAPLLRDAKAKWDRPTLTTLWKDNHTLCSERWRYIRYADGSEELYDRREDPREWHSLAGDSTKLDVLRAFRERLPQINAEPVPGSAGLDGRIEGVR